MTKTSMMFAAAGVAVALVAGPALAGADAWTKRYFDAGNTGNVGDDPSLTRENAIHLQQVGILPTSGSVNATPVVSDGLVFVGDGGSQGTFFYVFDLESLETLVRMPTGSVIDTPTIGRGVQSTALVGTVTVPDGEGTREERRVYIGANVKPKSFWCLSVSKILAAKADLLARAEPSDGAELLCEGADWPIMIAGVGDVENNALTAPLPVYNASPIFAQDQLVRVGHALERRDVVYTPTIGADCSDGQLWAVDAYTAEVLWTYDPVPNFQEIHPVTEEAVNTALGATVEGPADNPLGGGTAYGAFPGGTPGYGGVIWTVPTMSRDGKTIFVTTGDCVEQPQVGFQAESIVALDAVEGTVLWYHQRRLTDTSDYDIGNTAAVVDVEGENGCHVVVSPDKNGCLYGFRQAGDLPQVGSGGYDPLRPGQQRMLWRTCTHIGSLGGGFNASGANVDGRYVLAQAGGRLAPGDDAAGYLVDGCTGEMLDWTSSVSSGGADGAVASGMWFQPSGSRLQVFTTGPKLELLATVQLGSSAWSGGGVSIVDGTIFVPQRGDGVAIVQVVDGSNASPPQPAGTNTFNGPYPVPLGTGIGDQIELPADPYDPNSPSAGPVEEWPSMNP